MEAGVPVLRGGGVIDVWYWHGPGMAFERYRQEEVRSGSPQTAGQSRSMPSQSSSSSLCSSSGREGTPLAGWQQRQTTTSEPGPGTSCACHRLPSRRPPLIPQKTTKVRKFRRVKL